MSAQKFKFVLNLKQLMCFLALNFAFLDKSIWRQEKLSDNFPTVQNLGGGCGNCATTPLVGAIYITLYSPQVQNTKDNAKKNKKRQRGTE